MQYNDLVTAMSVYLTEEQPSSSYTTALPTIISKAELRCYRDLDLLATSAVNSSLTFTPGSRILSLTPATGTTISGGYPVAFPWPVTVEGLNAVIPPWVSPPFGARVRYSAVSWAFIDAVWPSEQTVSQPGVPFAYFAMLDDQTLITAPTPDLQYTAEVMGTWRPSPLSPTQQTSWMSNMMPDLLFDACMVEAIGYQRDFGAQSDDPRAALSWEARYQTDLARCREEELRRHIGRPPPIIFPLTRPGAPAALPATPGAQRAAAGA